MKKLNKTIELFQQEYAKHIVPEQEDEFLELMSCNQPEESTNLDNVSELNLLIHHSHSPCSSTIINVLNFGTNWIKSFELSVVHTKTLHDLFDERVNTKVFKQTAQVTI